MSAEHRERRGRLLGRRYPAGVRSVWVGAAGFLGAVARYQLDGLISRHVDGPFPWGTFAVNLSGCFVLGLLSTLLVGRLVADSALRTALTVGFLGAYTTFSTFTLQSVSLVRDGSLGLALAYVTASVVLGLLAAWAGMTAGHAI